MSFIGKLKRAERCEGALREIIEVMRQRYIPLGGADKAELDDIVVLARRVLHEPLFQKDQRVTILPDVEVDIEDVPTKVPGPSQGLVYDIDVRKDCAIYYIKMDCGGMFLWNDVKEAGQLQAVEAPKAPAEKSGLMKRDRFIAWAMNEGLDIKHDNTPKTTFLNADTQRAWRGWRAAIINRLVDDLRDDLMGDPDEEDDSTAEEKERSYMIKTEGGKSFRCVCGCNVFHKNKPKVRPEHYTCNACDETYTGEKVEPS